MTECIFFVCSQVYLLKNLYLPVLEKRLMRVFYLSLFKGFFVMCVWFH